MEGRSRGDSRAGHHGGRYPLRQTATSCSVKSGMLAHADAKPVSGRSCDPLQPGPVGVGASHHFLTIAYEQEARRARLIGKAGKNP
jgi:hypothetical protein